MFIFTKIVQVKTFSVKTPGQAGAFFHIEQIEPKCIQERKKELKTNFQREIELVMAIEKQVEKMEL